MANKYQNDALRRFVSISTIQAMGDEVHLLTRRETLVIKLKSEESAKRIARTVYEEVKNA